MIDDLRDLDAVGSAPDSRRPGVALPRLLIGWIVLISAEVFSGASLALGLWHPWTLGLTYWLYFCHFFFFTTLSIRTGRTALGSLYLWGVLYGMYESWITKVIWHGYGGDGKLVMGQIGPFGISELTMVFFFHPVMSFIVPLTVACVLCPPLQRIYPDLLFLVGRSRLARAFRVSIILSFAPIVAMNSGGPANLVLNAVFMLGVLLLLMRLARRGLDSTGAVAIVEFGSTGFVLICVFLAILYTLTYTRLRPEGLPSVRVQEFTLAFYAVPLLGLYLQGRQAPSAGKVGIDPFAKRKIMAVFAAVIILGFVMSFFRGSPFLMFPVLAWFVLWIVLSIILPVVVLGDAMRTWVLHRHAA